MKTLKTLAYVSIAALVSAAGFTSCSSEEELDEPKAQQQEQKGDFDGEEVKTEFSISLPGQATRKNMPGKIVQQAGLTDFQGMTQITLVPFARQSGSIAAGDARLGDTIALSEIVAGSELGTNSSAKVYSNVSIPLTTASFLFYAKSKAVNASTMAERGHLDPWATIGSNADPANIEFHLKPIVDALETPTGTGSKGEALIAYLNQVAQAKDATENIEWRNYTAAQSAAMTAMFETYSQNHSLSSFQVRRMMEDLYKSLIPLSTPIATAIKTAITTTYATWDDTTDPSNPTLVLDNSITGFPEDLGLPQGAVRVAYDNVTTKAFAACTAAQYTAASNTPLNLYTYPAELWYYANSLINTSNSSKKGMYDNSNDWAAIIAAHEAARSVNSLTRAVAITDPIQYGVARLDVTVKLQAGTLVDNTPVTPKSIACSSYPVTGVLVGGQKHVGFDFTPKGTAVYTLFDNVMSSNTMAATTSKSAANSTLVLETEAGANKNILIAVELVNNSGEDFIGVGGQLIPKGSKFYVVAELPSADATETGQRVFKQDYTTTANLTLKSLANAYNEIPDLRTPELELGFSVDLNWESGHTYDIEIN